eukprot:216027-Ditylum_brightwellii.AAC.1
MGDYRVADEFLGTHAQTLKHMIDSGVEVTEALEDELLGFQQSETPNLGAFISLSQPSLSRE